MIKIENTEVVGCEAAVSIPDFPEYKVTKNGVVTNPHGTFNVLNQEQLNRIYELHSEGLTDKEIANIIGCSRELVGRKIRKAGLR